MYDDNMMKAIVYKLIQNKIVKKKKKVTVAFVFAKQLISFKMIHNLKILDKE